MVIFCDNENDNNNNDTVKENDNNNELKPKEIFKKKILNRKSMNSFL